MTIISLKLSQDGQIQFNHWFIISKYDTLYFKWAVARFTNNIYKNLVQIYRKSLLPHSIDGIYIANIQLHNRYRKHLIRIGELISESVHCQLRVHKTLKSISLLLSLQLSVVIFNKMTRLIFQIWASTSPAEVMNRLLHWPKFI